MARLQVSHSNIVNQTMIEDIGFLERASGHHLPQLPLLGVHKINKNNS